MRPSLAGRLGSMFITIIMGALCAFLFVMTGLVLYRGEIGLGLILAAVAVFCMGLFFYVRRDMRGKRGWKIEIDEGVLALDLPRERSLIYRLEPVSTHLRFDEIAAVETRLEAYPSLGMANMHRVYALRLNTGDLIILGEDRALNTRLANLTLANTVERIVRDGKFEVRDLGMVEGKMGLLCVLFASAPPWDTPSLDDERQAVLWRKAGMTGNLAASAAFLTVFGARK